TEADLLVLDAGLLDMDFVEVLRELRSLNGRFLPAMLLVAPGDEASRRRGIDAGIDDVFEGPIDPKALAPPLELLLRFKDVSDELERSRLELQQTRNEHRALIGSLVHDFKNPIAIVHANLGWAVDHVPPEQTDIIDALQDAQEGINRLQTMAEDLLLL